VAVASGELELPKEWRVTDPWPIVRRVRSGDPFRRTCSLRPYVLGLLVGADDVLRLGVRLACLVNASVTVCGDDSIYAFGGFDQYTDEGALCVCVCVAGGGSWVVGSNTGS
jgi:hypothetical protein